MCARPRADSISNILWSLVIALAPGAVMTSGGETEEQVLPTQGHPTGKRRNWDLT